MSEEVKRTEIGTIGEFGLIDRIKERTQSRVESTVKGIGDDCAVIDVGPNYMVITTDTLAEGIHFDLSYTPLKHLGYKAIAVNVSDVAAMNAIASQVTVSIAISNRMSVEAVDELYEGIEAACENFKVDLIGGDTTSSQSGLVITVTAIGAVDKDKVVYRNGAKVGDVVCVTGDLGGAFMGLNVLEREKQVYMANPEMQPELDDNSHVVNRLLKPEARLDIIHDLNDAGVVPHAMIDISDGLASELFHICTQSGTGVHVFEEHFPVDDNTYNLAIDFGIGSATTVLNGGEDYELLFTCSEEDWDKIKDHHDIVAIGQIKEESDGYYLVSKAGKVHKMQAQGWQHFNAHAETGSENEEEKG